MEESTSLCARRGIQCSIRFLLGLVTNRRVYEIEPRHTLIEVVGQVARDQAVCVVHTLGQRRRAVEERVAEINERRAEVLELDIGTRTNGPVEGEERRRRVEAGEARSE